MDHHAGSLDVAQEFMAEADSFRCTLDQSRDICDNKSAAALKVYDTEVRGKCGKVIICNFRFCICHAGKQGRFSNVRETDESDVRDDFQFHSYFQLLCRLAWLGVFRNLHGSGCVMHISVSAFSAF